MSYLSCCPPACYGRQPNVNVNINIRPGPRARRHPHHTERDYYEMQAAALENAHAYERERRLRYEQQLHFQAQQQQQQLALHAQQQQQQFVHPTQQTARGTRHRSSRSVSHTPQPLTGGHTQRRITADVWPGRDIPAASYDVGLERESAARRHSERSMGTHSGMPSQTRTRASEVQPAREPRMSHGGGMSHGTHRTRSRLSQLGVRFNDNVEVRTRTRSSQGSGL
ncbi:MAG: hypothetical protein LQ337_005156 [Flavoplaca oasis]|nr:MAG: hypothetical protein LQ337_005156 [Flavoplaca oasis]